MNPAGKFCLVLVCAASSLWAQQSAPIPNSTTAQSATLTFSVEVTDKAGHPIQGLQQSDFTLLDNKSPSPIQGFSAHTPGPQSPETAALLIDMINMGFGGDSTARDQIMAFLRNSGGRLPYPISLLLFTDAGVTPVGGPSDDPKVLLAALKTQQGQLRSVGRSAGYWGAAEREQRSIAALSVLVDAMQSMPGRKLLIWIGPGWPIFDNPSMTYSNAQLRGMFAKVVSLSSEMTQAQIALYHVDPLGGWDAGNANTFLWESYTKPLQRWNNALPGNLALQVLATQSGGLELSGSNDVAGEVGDCAQDGAAWYTITFAPQASEKPNTWHSIEVKVDKHGLKVRTRAGYYAQP